MNTVICDICEKQIKDWPNPADYGRPKDTDKKLSLPMEMYLGDSQNGGTKFCVRIMTSQENLCELCFLRELERYAIGKLEELQNNAKNKVSS